MNNRYVSLNPGAVAEQGSISRWADARRILCIRLDNLGDVLMTTPAIRALQNARLGRHITLLGSASGCAGARFVPEIQSIIRYDAPWMKAPGNHPGATPEADERLISELRMGRFDAAVIFTTYSQSPLPAAVFCRLAGIPLRLAHCRENPYTLLTNWAVEVEPQEKVRHEVQRQLDLVASIGATTENDGLSFRVPVSDRTRVAARLQGLGLAANTPYVLIHPGATAPSRRYPVEYFAAAADQIAERLQCPIVLGGTPAEVPLVQEMRGLMKSPIVNLAGDLSLGECAASIAMAHVLVANNSGPVHLAAAVGTPVVDLYALTNPQHTPWRVASKVLSYDVPCRHCYRSICPEGHHDCLRRVPVEQVADSAIELFEARRLRPRKPLLTRNDLVTARAA